MKFSNKKCSLYFEYNSIFFLFSGLEFFSIWNKKEDFSLCKVIPLEISTKKHRKSSLVSHHISKTTIKELTIAPNFFLRKHRLLMTPKSQKH
jgi:hypothetical protein